jgi:DNA repair protein RecN (Recombination protein N)
MLKRLFISNFALIEEMDVEFPGKLTVITGETGAGKSIFLEALGLALGKRADLSTLRQRNKKCIVEAEFDLQGAVPLPLVPFVESENKTLILRREIGVDGRSRSFINDALVSLAELKTASEQLIDVHSQHQTLLINNAGFQTDVVDSFAEITGLVNEYAAAFRELKELEKQLVLLKEQRAHAMKQADYNKFLFSELETLKLEDGYLKKLEEEALMLENASHITGSLSESLGILEESENNILGGLIKIKQLLNPLSKFGTQYAQLSERIVSCYVELKDVAAEIAHTGEHVTADGNKLQELNTTLDLYHRLLKKHSVTTEQGLREIRSQLEAELMAVDSAEAEIEKVVVSMKAIEARCLTTAKRITTERKKAVPTLENKVKKLLAGLSMEDARFTVRIQPLDEIGPAGADDLQFLFSANKGMAENELSKVASGGELSRLMLTLKAILATKKKMPAVVFDEIDTGVSGEVADKIGNLLSDMGRRMQVIVITHLPQMASKGAHHLFVYKENTKSNTASYIKKLDEKERVYEIAKMLSTGSPTPTALSNAQELLSYN